MWAKRNSTRPVTARIQAGLAVALAPATGACTCAAPGPDDGNSKYCVRQADPDPINWHPLTGQLAIPEAITPNDFQAG